MYIAFERGIILRKRRRFHTDTCSCEVVHPRFELTRKFTLRCQKVKCQGHDMQMDGWNVFYVGTAIYAVVNFKSCLCLHCI